MNATQLFARGWISFGLDDIRPTDSTYSGGDFDALPPLPAIRPNLEWLVPLHPKIEEAMQPYRPSSEDREEFVENCHKIIAIAKSEDVPLPDVFARLMRAFELQDRIPSCTACYFDLPSGIMHSPFRSRDRIVRFLNDQQVCVCWYLYIPHDAEPFVVASCGLDGEPFLDAIDFPASPSLVAKAKQSTFYAAHSFEEFLYRFWIENTIWFCLDLGIQLTGDQLNYVRSMQPDFKDPHAA